MVAKEGQFKRFWLGKLFSLFGIFPLGIYVFIHLYKNMTSLKGEVAFNEMLQDGHRFPFWGILMILVLWVPITFHGLYGLTVLKKGKPNLVQFPYFQNLKYVLQRLSGLGLLLFIPAHLYNTRISQGILHSRLDFHHMVEGFSEWITVIVYALGVLGVSYHLANGIWQFLIGWGLIGSAKAMRWSELISIGIFVILALMGFTAMWGFIRAGTLF